MLEDIKERSSGWVAWVIAALIIIPMGFWGVTDYVSPDPDAKVIEVGGQKITQSQFQTQLRSAQERQRNLLGDQVNEEVLSSDTFKQSVLQQMVSRAVLSEVADQQHYQIGNEQLSNLIKEIPSFQKDGQFSQELYDGFLARSLNTSAQFEARFRSDTRLNQVLSAYENSAIVLPDDVRQLLQIQATRRQYDLVSIDSREYIKQQTVTEQEIQQFYEKKQALFAQPEQLSIDFIELNIEQELAKVSVSDEELKAIYQATIDAGDSAYKTEETREISHILLAVDSENSEGEQKTKAFEYVSKLREGYDFGTLAKEVSDDPGSAKSGGDLGLVERGQMVSEFENASYQLTLNQISDPVKTEFGYHIIKVTKVNPPVVKSFAKAKQSIEVDEKYRLAEEALILKVEQLRNLAFEQPDSLDAIADELGLSIQQSDMFTRYKGNGISDNTEIRDTAFSDEVLSDGLNSEPIALPSERYIVLRKRQYDESRTKELEEVKDQVTDLLKAEKARNQATQEGERLLVSAEKGWESLLNQIEQDKKMKTLAVVSKGELSLLDNNNALPIDLVESVLSINKGSQDQVSADSVNQEKSSQAHASYIKGKFSDNGHYYIVHVTHVVKEDIAKMNAQLKEQTRRLLASRNGSAIIESYIESVKQDMGATISPDAL